MVVLSGPFKCPSIEVRTATTRTTDDDYDQDYDEDPQRPTMITIEVTTKTVHRH